MGLRDTIAIQVTSAFATVDDLKTTITVYVQSTGSYDETTGTVTRNNTAYPVNAVLTQPKRMELEDPAIRATDTIALIDPSEQPLVAPQIGMRVDVGSEEHDVVKVLPIGPADAGPALLWKLFLRRPSAEAI
jgi:hypothetical protein